MAIVEKTIEYAFPMITATVVDATVTNLTQITIEIPEASPTFVSVFAEVGFQDIVTASGGTITEYRVGLRLGAAGYTTITELDDIANTGENVSLVLGPYDFASHFTTNWTGTSMTCDMQVYFDQNTGTTLGMVNVTGKLYITYSYDDTAATQIKTVRIPMESLTAGLPTTATNFGTNQIPQLTGAGGFLPENTPVIVDWWIQLEGNEGTSATTDFTISANIDGGATTTFGNQEAALLSSRFGRWIYKPASVPDPTAAHNLQLWSSLASRGYVTATLFVTYKFTLSGTTETVVSALIPWEMPSPLGYTTSGDASRFAREIIVSEPGTITLLQSAFRINYNTISGAGTLSLRAGSQAYRNYTVPGNLVYCGMNSYQQRIDSGSAQGAGMTLAGGPNDIVIDGYHSSATVRMTNLNGYILLNYKCSVPTQGIGAATHTILKHVGNYDALVANARKYTAVSIGVTPANYYLMSCGFCWIITPSLQGNGYVLSAELQSGEGAGAGYRDLYADVQESDSELGTSLIFVRARDDFKRFPQDADTNRMDIETARDVVAICDNNVRFGLYMMATVHHITYTVGGTISGHDAALPTDLQCCRAATGEVMQRQTLAAGVTSFSFTVYENDQNYYVDAYQDATHVGRSAEALPT